MPKLQNAVVSFGMNIIDEITTTPPALIMDVLEARAQIELAVELEMPTEELWDNFASEMEGFIASQPALPGEVEELLKRIASPF